MVTKILRDSCCRFSVLIVAFAALVLSPAGEQPLCSTQKDRAAKVENRSVSVESAALSLMINPANGTISFTDKSNRYSWITRPKKGLKLYDVCRKTPLSVEFKLVDEGCGIRYRIRATVSNALAEAEFFISPIGNLPFKSLDFPGPVDVDRTTTYVLPVSEGLLLPATSVDIPATLLHKGSWPMPFVGAINGRAGWMMTIGTPADFAFHRTSGPDGTFSLCPRWTSEKGRFGYERRVRVTLFRQGDYVAMAKRYRRLAAGDGLLVTLKNKALRKPDINRLIGAVDLWYWGDNTVRMAKEMSASGIGKVLFSTAQDSYSISYMNGLGYLTSRYDMYQDTWSPEDDGVSHNHKGWPDALVVGADGRYMKWFPLKKNGKEFSGGLICSTPALAMAKKEIPEELSVKSYTARFIDATTSTPLRECYSQSHPTTRSADLLIRLMLLEYLSGELNLVLGSEDGLAAAVPFVDYLEGMMSPSFARLPDSGYNFNKRNTQPVSDRFLTYQAGEYYRIPLWRLALGDCAVSTWYWGDSSNVVPELWWKKDLLNILYGTMPLWTIVDWRHWQELRDRFIASYINVGPVFEKLGFEEMLSHRFVTEDRSVQETVFTGDIKVYVNFGNATYNLPSPSLRLPPRSFTVMEKNAIWRSGGYS